MAVFGAMAALGMAWFMHYLITSTETGLSDARRVQMLDFVRLARDESSQRKDRTPERPQVNQAPDIPASPDNNASADTQPLTVSMAPLETGLEIARSGGFSSGEGEYMPIVKVAPIYPPRAENRRIAGKCLVTYTVTTLGTVKNVNVVKDQCTSELFYRTSVEAALRFKYKPRVIDGEPVEVVGVPNMFHYELAEEHED